MTVFLIISEIWYRVCVYDKAEHKGTIINILYNEKTNKPKIAYILDAYSSQVLPLIYNTLYKAYYENLEFIEDEDELYD